MAFPTTAAPSLNPLQCSWRGLTMGPPTAYGIYSIDGLGLPNLSSADSPRGRRHGEIKGLDTAQGRDITLTGDISKDGTSLDHAVTNLGALLLADEYAGDVEYPFWVAKRDGSILGCMARARNHDLSLDISYEGGLVPFAMQLHASDPRLYSTVSTVSRSGTGSVTLSNTGNAQALPVVTVTGPILTGWTLVYGGQTITVNKTLGSGDTFSIDMDTGICLYTTGGVASDSRSSLAGLTPWFRLVGGSSAALTLAGSGTSGATALSVQFCSAWIL